jgi:hypothetical protein
MSDTMMSVKEPTIDISDTEMTSDSEIESEGKIYGKKYISVDGKALSTDMKTADTGSAMI